MADHPRNSDNLAMATPSGAFPTSPAEPPPVFTIPNKLLWCLVVAGVPCSVPSCLSPTACVHGGSHASLHVGFAGGSFPSGSVEFSGGAGASARSPRGILRSQRRPSLARPIAWDEKTIADHDLERGTREKIVEPKTPYHRPRDDMVDSEEEEEVTTARAARAGAEGQCAAAPPRAPRLLSHRVCFVCSAQCCWR